MKTVSMDDDSEIFPQKLFSKKHKKYFKKIKIKIQKNRNSRKIKIAKKFKTGVKKYISKSSILGLSKKKNTVIIQHPHRRHWG